MTDARVHEKDPAVFGRPGLRYYCRQRPTLPYSFPYSTIGGSRLNFRVRNGNGCDPAPMTTGILGAWGSAFARGASSSVRRLCDLQHRGTDYCSSEGRSNVGQET